MKVKDSLTQRQCYMAMAIHNKALIYVSSERSNKKFSLSKNWVSRIKNKLKRYQHSDWAYEVEGRVFLYSRNLSNFGKWGLLYFIFYLFFSFQWIYLVTRNRFFVLFMNNMFTFCNTHWWIEITVFTGGNTILQQNLIHALSLSLIQS